MILYFLSVIAQLDPLETEKTPEVRPHSVAIVSCNGEAIKNITDKTYDTRAK